MKHTKGKWSLPHLADDTASCDCGFILCEQYYGAIATIHWSKSRKIEDGDNPPLEEAKANAKLIAAAPELLKIAIEYNQEMDRLFYQNQLHKKGHEHRLFIKQVIKEATE